MINYLSVRTKSKYWGNYFYRNPKILRSLKFNLQIDSIL